jgi:exonuclease VII small subunit|tara:strand:- start:506 stop:739 length:234 start_codon:yes stop_codon:yes gene_type:complete
MKNENIPASVKSKSIKEAREEINDILNKLESKEVDLVNCVEDYQKLIKLNKYVDTLFKKRVKEIASIASNDKINDKK